MNETFRVKKQEIMDKYAKWGRTGIFRGYKEGTANAFRDRD